MTDDNQDYDDSLYSDAQEAAYLEKHPEACAEPSAHKCYECGKPADLPCLGCESYYCPCCMPMNCCPTCLKISEEEERGAEADSDATLGTHRRVA